MFGDSINIVCMGLLSMIVNGVFNGVVMLGM